MGLLLCQRFFQRRYRVAAQRLIGRFFLSHQFDGLAVLLINPLALVVQAAQSLFQLINLVQVEPAQFVLHDDNLALQRTDFPPLGLCLANPFDIILAAGLDRGHLAKLGKPWRQPRLLCLTQRQLLLFYPYLFGNRLLADIGHRVTIRVQLPGDKAAIQHATGRNRRGKAAQFFHPLHLHHAAEQKVGVQPSQRVLRQHLLGQAARAGRPYAFLQFAQVDQANIIKLAFVLQPVVNLQGPDKILRLDQ